MNKIGKTIGDFQIGEKICVLHSAGSFSNAQAQKRGYFFFNKSTFNLRVISLALFRSTYDESTSMTEFCAGQWLGQLAISCLCGNLWSLLIHKQFALHARRNLLPSSKQEHETLQLTTTEYSLLHGRAVLMLLTIFSFP